MLPFHLIRVPSPSFAARAAAESCRAAYAPASVIHRVVAICAAVVPARHEVA